MGAKAYYLRRVLHDYFDEDCIRILRPLAEATSNDSVLLIADMIVPAICSEADISAAVMDITTMTMGGKERTEKGFLDILAKSGLNLEKVWRSAAGANAIIEVHLA